MKRVILVTIILSAISQIARGADDKAADALITKGLELRREGRGLEAIDLFQRAVALAPTARSVGQLGLAESAVEHWSDAEEHLNASLASPQDPWVKRNQGALDQALTLVRAHIGQISLTGPAGAFVIISGKAVGTLPLIKPIRANAGPAIVTATTPGFRPFEMSVPVEVGKETQLKIVLEPLGPPQALALPSLTAPSALQQSQRGPSWRTLTGASLLVGGGGLAAWGIVWIAVDGRSSGNSCSAGARPGCVNVYTTKTPGIVLTGVGAGAAIAGGILIYPTKPHTAEVGVVLGPSALSLAGRF